MGADSFASLSDLRMSCFAACMGAEIGVGAALPSGIGAGEVAFFLSLVEQETANPIQISGIANNNKRCIFIEESLFLREVVSSFARFINAKSPIALLSLNCSLNAQKRVRHVWLT
jgi:hypothetical protein